jgi:cellulose synthase/poly-beta-1,6-N-acetylglucosamine synthase-like glycosyltransferase
MAAVLRQAGAGLGADRLKSGAFALRLVSKEVPLNWNAWFRQIHRWLSIIFTVAVIANFVPMGLGKPWVVYSPLLLFLLLFTGLYLFALPYATRWRSLQRSSGLD